MKIAGLRMWMLAAAVLLPIIGVFGFEKEAIAAGGPHSPLKLTIVVDGDRVIFKLLNKGSFPVAYVDSWKNNLGIPGNAWIEAKDGRGKMLTRTKATPTGQWNPLVFSSDVVELPVQQLATLAPGESRQARGSIKACLDSLSRLTKNTNRPTKIRLGCKVYLDRELRTATSSQTPWLDYMGVKAPRG